MSTFSHSNGKGVDLCVSWVNASGSDIPAGAISVGDNVYIARSMFNGEMTPGKAASGHSSCYLPFGGAEESSEVFQVLCDTCDSNLPGSGYKWEPWSGNTAPKYALIGGTSGGSPLYVARAPIEGQWTAGKYFPENGIAYFPFGGQEHELTEGFEVLTMCKRSG